MAAHVAGLARLIGLRRSAGRHGTIADSGFDLHLIGMQQVRNCLFPGRNVFVTDGLLARIVFAVVVT
jgi:hypothetical protein